MTHPLLDPQLLWEQMIEAHAEGDGKAGEEHAIELLHWLKAGRLSAQAACAATSPAACRPVDCAFYLRRRAGAPSSNDAVTTQAPPPSPLHAMQHPPHARHGALLHGPYRLPSAARSIDALRPVRCQRKSAKYAAPPGYGAACHSASKRSRSSAGSENRMRRAARQIRAA